MLLELHGLARLVSAGPHDDGSLIMILSTQPVPALLLCPIFQKRLLVLAQDSEPECVVQDKQLLAGHS